MPVIGAYMVPHPPMIVPAVGHGGERKIEATKHAYETVAEEIAVLQPDTIVITSPHAVMYADYFHISPGFSAAGNFGRFNASQISFRERYDTALVAEICRLAENAGFPAGTMGEREPELDHGTMVPLYFIRQKWKGGKIVRIGLSGLPLADHYRLGQLIAEAAERTSRRIVFVASGDLSHKLLAYGPYGFAPEGPVYDRRVMESCGNGRFGELLEFEEGFCQKAAECGHRSFVIMAGALDGYEVTAKQLSHEDVTGVGYGICTFHPGEKHPERRFLDAFLKKTEADMIARRSGEDEFVRLARETIEAHVLGRPHRETIPETLRHEAAGVFVSLHKQGTLRGCIGTILPVTKCIGEEIVRNAVSAATSDPRFDPVRPDELKWLEIHVDVLSKPEPVLSKGQLDTKRYGVIVTSGQKRGLLLPDLEGIDSVDQQVDIARRKAGISQNEPIQLQRFEVKRHY
ncbi:MAG: AmmeMemoRadiSam system protein A [Clostridia bacterium]|nr:AmmeMemoRadiSam system protein A [Clostridia bacterium]